MGRLEDLGRGAQVDGIRPDGPVKRWIYGVPPAGNANFAWVQPFVHPCHPPGLALVRPPVFSALYPKESEEKRMIDAMLLAVPR